MNSENRPSRVSLRDIAKKVGVSHVTVSLALRDHPRVSEPVRLKIRQVAEEMNYRPDPMLRALSIYRREKSEAPVAASIGWINAWQRPEELRGHKEFDLYWKGAEAAAKKFGYRLEEFQLGGSYTPRRLHQILSARGIQGLLLPPQKAAPDWQDFPWNEYSVVRFGRSLQTPRTHLVTSDHVANTILAFEKIHELGYRRIGMVTNESDQRKSGHLFEGGYFIAQRSVDEKERVPVFTLSDAPAGERSAAMAAWVRKYRVDAIFTDIADIPRMLKKAGLTAPGDVGLAVTTVLDTTIDSGINQEAEEIGRVAFLMLNSLINDGARGIPRVFRQILVEGTWVNGNSLPDRTKLPRRTSKR